MTVSQLYPWIAFGLGLILNPAIEYVETHQNIINHRSGLAAAVSVCFVYVLLLSLCCRAGWREVKRAGIQALLIMSLMYFLGLLIGGFFVQARI